MISDGDGNGIREGEPPQQPSVPDGGIREGPPPASASRDNAPSIRIPQPLINSNREFREQIEALGVAWALLAMASGCAAALVIDLGAGNDQPGHRLTSRWMAFVGGALIVWFPIGVLTCFKKIWAVYIGLALSYVLALGPLLVAGIALALGDDDFLCASMPMGCGSVIYFLLILQAHRVIALDKWLRASEHIREPGLGPE